MVTNRTFEISAAMIVFICVGTVLLSGLLIVMHRRHKYAPNLIGALIGAFLCFLLLEALPALT